MLNEFQYKELCKKLHTEAGIKSSLSRRRGYEQQYFQHHAANGVKLRGKYRP